VISYLRCQNYRSLEEVNFLLSPLTAIVGPNGAGKTSILLSLGIGTALVYPTLIAAISDAVSPVERAPAVGIYRFWRDMGYVAGGLIAGIAADAIDYAGAIAIVAALTAASGLWVLVDMPSPPSHERKAKQEQPPRTELPDEIKVVRSGPVLDDLAVLDAADHDPPDPDRAAAVVALGDPARRDTVTLRDLILHPDREVAVAEDELVEPERLADPIVPAVLSRVYVVVKVLAVDAHGCRRVAARAHLLERVAGELCRIASRHR
jgi:MFS transporter/AAA domain-containing protein